MTEGTSSDRTGPQGSARRTFLKRSAILAGGAVPIAALAGVVHAGVDETIKVALIGCGGRGTGAVAQVLATAGPIKLWAMADLFPDRLTTSLDALKTGQEADYDRQKHSGYAAKIDVPPERRFVGFDAYKSAIESGVDLVILATSPHFRPAQFAYAVAQGKHVFMEKPVAVDAPGVRQVLAAAKEAHQKSLKVGVGFQRRHHQLYQETMKRLHDGAIGPVRLIRVYWNCGAQSVVPRTPTMTEMEYQMRNWTYFTWLSGDHIVEQHVHNLDVAHWLMGRPSLEAHGMGGRQVRTEAMYGQIFDHHAVEYTYDDGVKLLSQCRQIAGCWRLVAEHALGLGGSAQIERGQIDGTDKWRFRGKAPNPYQSEHDVLVEAIRNNKPHNEAEHGALSTMMAILGRMATYSGKALTWNEAINSELKLAPPVYAMDAEAYVMPDKHGYYPVPIPGVTKAF